MELECFLRVLKCVLRKGFHGFLMVSRWFSGLVLRSKGFLKVCLKGLSGGFFGFFYDSSLLKSSKTPNASKKNRLCLAKATKHDLEKGRMQNGQEFYFLLVRTRKNDGEIIGNSP